MKSMIGLAAVMGAFLVVPTHLVAEEQYHVLESSRNRGRGDTFVAAFDSDEATRGNPATLAETKISYQLRVLQLDMFLGDNTIASVKQVTNLNQESSATGLLSTFGDKFGKRQYGRLQVAPLAMRFGAFEVMPFMTTTNYLDLRDPALPEISLQSDTYYGISMSYAMELAKDFEVGVTLRPGSRTTYTGSIGLSDLLDATGTSNFQLTNLFSKGDGTVIGMDIGGIYKPSPDWRFGLLVQNFGYTSSLGSGGPKPMQQVISVGMTNRTNWQPWHWDNFFDYQDLVNPQKTSLYRLLHAGTEFGRSYVSRDHDIGVMAGLNEGYLTMGSFIDLYVTRLTVSYYAAELGEYPGQRKDRRWAITLLSSMTF